MFVLKRISVAQIALEHDHHGLFLQAIARRIRQQPVNEFLVRERFGNVYFLILDLGLDTACHQRFAVDPHKLDGSIEGGPHSGSGKAR